MRDSAQRFIYGIQSIAPAVKHVEKVAKNTFLLPELRKRSEVESGYT